MSGNTETHKHRMGLRTMTKSTIFLLSILVLAIMPSMVNGLYFFLEGTDPKCFVEELPADTTVVGTYKSEVLDPNTNTWVVNGDNKIVAYAEVIETKDRVMHQKAEASGRFVFTTHSFGSHHICIGAANKGWFSNEKVRLHLDLLFGDASHDVAQPHKEHLMILLNKLRGINSKIKTIRSEQNAQRDREMQFRNTSESVNTRVRNWTLLQMLAVVLACAWQVRQLRTFFVAKKLV